MPRPLAEQVAVVVGASSGIGRATALAFAARGPAVVAAARDLPALRQLVAEIEAGGGRALAVECDVTDPDAVRRLADRAEERFGRIDTWVNDAGVLIVGAVEDTPVAEFARLLQVNVLGQVAGAQAALPALRRAGGGAIIGLGSVESYRSVPLQSAYAASKAAVRAFNDALRLELAQASDRISVTTVLPAGVDTPVYEHARTHLDRLPKAPPPAYPPEVVAEAIVRAAVHPTREVPVGAAAVAFVWGQRLSPALTEALMRVGGLVWRMTLTNRSDDGVDNLDAPSAPRGQIRGSYGGRDLARRPVPLTNLRTPGELLGGLVSRVRRLVR